MTFYISLHKFRTKKQKSCFLGNRLEISERADITVSKSLSFLSCNCDYNAFAELNV